MSEIIQEYRNLINLEFNNPVGGNEIDAAINWVIHKINLLVGGQKVLLEATGVGEEDWDDVSTDNWEDWDTGDWESLGRFKNLFDWDSDDYSLTIPDNIVTVEIIYLNYQKYESVTYDKMKNNTDSYYFTKIDNKIYFAKDLHAATEDIKILCRINWTDIDNEGYIFVPNQWKDIIVAGAVMRLGTRDRNVISDASLELAVKEFEDGKTDIWGHYALINSAASNKLTGIDEIDLSSDLGIGVTTGDDYGT